MKHSMVAGLGVGVVGLVITAGIPGAQQAPSRAIVIDGATLVDVVDGTTVPDAVVVIEGARVKAAGGRGEVTPPAGARVIDARGKFVLPGLTDMHVHFRDWMPELFLAHGVTSVLDVANPTEWILALKEGVEDGNIRGPRIFTTGGLLDGPPAAKGHHVLVETPQQAAEAAARLAERDIDAIKVYTHMTPELIRAAADVAHRHNLPVMGHLGISARDAVLAGVDNIAHSTGIAFATISDPAQKAAAINEGIRELLGTQHAAMDPATFDDLIALLVERKVFIEADLVTVGKGIQPRSDQFQEEWRTLFSNPKLAYVPAENVLRWQALHLFDRNDAERVRLFRQGFTNLTSFLRRFVKAGGKVLGASDTQHYVPPGITLHQELELLVSELGMTPLDAIRTVTVNAGAFLRRDDVGNLRAGSLADMIVVREDPLKNLGSLRNPDVVIVNGRVQDTAYHLEYRIPIPRPSEETAGGHPQPALTAIAPVVAVEATADDDSAVQLTVTGSSFVPTSLIQFDGTPVRTVFANRQRLEGWIPAMLLRRPGTFPVTVWTPRPGGGESEPVNFIVKFRRPARETAGARQP